MGVLGLRRGVLRGIFGAAARREWAVLPRNSAVFEWCEGAARRFSARRTVPGDRGENFFKNLLERGGKPKIGVREGSDGGLGAPYIGCAVQFLGVIFEPGS